MDTAPQAEHIRFLFDPQVALTTFAGQRRRFASTVETLSMDELAAPSRCAGWTVADVLRHLVWVDLTVRRLWSGDEAIADGFDPRVTPNEAVEDDRKISDEETRERYLVSTETMVKDLGCASPQRFGLPSLSPAGKVPWWMSAVHIGWDSSIHERDALLPLGRDVEEIDVETELCLAYSLVLTSFFAGRDPLAVRVGTIDLSRGAGPVVAGAIPTAGRAADSTDDPATVVAVDDPVKVIDALSGRGQVEDSLRGDAAVVRRLGGLARYFTSAPR